MNEYRWITAKAAAEIAHVSTRLIYVAIRSGALRSTRLGSGRSVRTTEQWVHEWLAASATGGPQTRDERVGVRPSA